jgi:hypothetical protein
MKAYMIADLNNPTSVRYTEIAIESWKPVSELDIEVIQCQTPDTIEVLEELYNWQPLLHNLQDGKESTKSERAGDISHWQLIRRRANNKGRFFVMEHDSYLLDADEFKRQFNFGMEHGLDYMNCGLFMSCYSFSPRCAKYINELLLEKAFPLNGGPYGCVERLVKTFLTHKNKNDREYTFLTHTPNGKVEAGQTAQDLFHVYNFPLNKSKFELASTQVISKSLGITQDHDGMQRKPWERSKYFKIID